MILRGIAYGFAVALGVAGVTIIAYVATGVMAAGNLWLLLPLTCYGLAFWMLGRLVDSL